MKASFFEQFHAHYEEDLTYWYLMVGEHSIFVSKGEPENNRYCQNGWGLSIEKSWDWIDGYPFEYNIWFYLFGWQFLISFSLF